jgi:STAM-binding protein
LEPVITSAQIPIRDNNAERRVPPILPPKQYIEPSKAIVDGAVESRIPSFSSKLSKGPQLPEKVRLSEDTPPAKPDLDPASYTFKPSAYLENGSPLRSVFLPASLRARFLSLASSNTKNNLETCGILCGTLVSNALFISRLVIPEQIATSDTCETTNESALFDYCDSEDLIMLGWIHTHPTQTCFMSSRDLHTHSGYQVMLPESIAIVCAPSKNPDWGVFRLTDPPGLKTVLNCTQTGLFHPHAEVNIYTGALRPGHVFEVNGLEYETVDLRPKGQ